MHAFSVFTFCKTASPHPSVARVAGFQWGEPGPLDGLLIFLAGFVPTEEPLLLGDPVTLQLGILHLKGELLT